MSSRPPVPRNDPRRERSRATRRRVVEAAYRLLVERGYGVPLAEVAAAAGVSVQHVYFAFGSKRALVREALQLAMLGGGGEPPTALPWLPSLTAAPDAAAALRAWVRQTLPILARVAPLAGIFRSAPDLAEMWEESEQRRLAGCRELTGRVAAKGALREGLDVAAAADLVYVLLSPVVYGEFVSRRLWTPERWAAWSAESIAALLLG